MGQFRANLLVEVLGGLIVAAVLAAVALISGFVGDFNAFKHSITWGYLVGGGLATVAVTIYLRRRYNRLRPEFEPIDVDFRVLRKELLYEYKDHERLHLCYSKRVDLRALRQGLESYRDKYLWTGRGEIKIASGVKGQTFREAQRKSVWQLYEIGFNRCLNCDEEISTVLHFGLVDREKKAVPFFSATIEEPTDFLALELVLPEACGVDEVVCEESCSIGAKTPYKTQTKRLTNGRVRWEVPRPKLLHHYEVRWNFPAL